ncbi:hypothetical protein F5J12DRAFT_778795 [Pisolithus orientalis]|uniref:uncharacterized protein n=1 Tax=Pisolithus orientalis TaxID=936130 RepID=UPI002224F228|nr:uncharacterized protein F5J12DRAFT_778795 [Pisolithus orientalis]KAI6035327.1 hypothetical protein F5J12DRAFT_778795 [Pisolithus orientalis]
MPSPHLESGILPPQCKLTPDSHITQTHPRNWEDPSFLGRGTVCYLACYNGEYYIIKDYWVEESEQRTALHEVNMMKLVQDIDRVPKLQHYWVIEVELGIVDNTEQYRDEKWQCRKSPSSCIIRARWLR